MGHPERALSLPLSLSLSLCSVSMSWAEAERRTTCVLWQQYNRSTKEAVKRLATLFAGREGVAQGAAKKTETNYVCLMRKGSSLSSSLSEGETDMQMQHIQYRAVAKYVPA